MYLVGRLPAAAQSAPLLQDEGATLEFPNQLTFKARFAPGPTLDRAILEYGVDRLTCSPVTAKAFPVVNRSTDEVIWTWDMRKSGLEPLGAKIWYRWRATDTAGHESVTATQRVTWLDAESRWQSISQDHLTLHWYNKPQDFATDLLTSADQALSQLEQTTGVTPTAPIDLYIYPTTAELRAAILYEPGWTGGLAYPEYSSVAIGIAFGQSEWGKRAEAHELTHVLVGQLTFSCLTSIPTWLNEGMAVYGEGGPDPATRAQLQRAIADDKLIPLRALSGGFSEIRDTADLSYVESYSVVHFLIAQFGAARVRQLFADEREGRVIEEALRDTYGLGLDSLEDRWRAAIGAPARAAAAPPTAAPTAVPTYALISAWPQAPPADLPADAAGTGAFPILSGALVGLVIGLSGLFLWTLRRNRP